MISLGEGNTPLVTSARIDQTPSSKLKFTNPAGSDKDRFMKRDLLSKSSGNTGTSVIPIPGFSVDAVIKGVEAIADASVAITHGFARLRPPSNIRVVTDHDVWAAGDRLLWNVTSLEAVVVDLRAYLDHA